MWKKVASCILWVFIHSQIFSQYNTVDKLQLKTSNSSFYGYTMHDFIYNGRACKIVIPHKTAKGNPWIWRARFWGHEPQTDTVLLSKGYHVVYCDVVELYGNNYAVKIWNKFYALMQKGGLAKKVVLEGMSRGGLYIYNWAAENPDKVACVYADAPVLDIKSWPGGLGSGPGSQPEWDSCKKAWNLFSKDQIRRFKNSPLDKVKKIVKGGYPMLHVCGEDDEVVPMSENTDLFEQRVRAHGGNITVLRKKGVKHHPHSLKDPTVIVDFILRSNKIQ
ncbi:alpha/beta hydrolase family protein [Lacibacter sp.]|uniref:alpha/beta hydrolase family protein n=1 Tax=Lacibacter sp. TaxID=1915409 RepID=UPI002B4B75B4|nr:prolyl oligopeptidase family serine peptidase [Lacibacter sp.]HLP38183.1 prolyl oligopeptidase family serine peptidase [Lacibacter sp.]